MGHPDRCEEVCCFQPPVTRRARQKKGFSVGAFWWPRCFWLQVCLNERVMNGGFPPSLAAPSGSLGPPCHTNTAALVSVWPRGYKGRGWAPLQHAVSKHPTGIPRLTQIAFLGRAWKRNTTFPSSSEMLIAHKASWQGVLISLNWQLNNCISRGNFGRCLLLQHLCGSGLWKGM